MNTLYTIGHSNHEIEYFLDLLKAHKIDVIIDVRSTPASRYNPQYNKVALQRVLREQGIRYAHFGSSFGARRDEPELHDENGRVDFRKVQKTQEFLDGVGKLKEGLRAGYRLSLMCSEALPTQCHRFSMVANYVHRSGTPVHHILPDGQVVDHEEVETELLAHYLKKKKLPVPSLFEPDIDEAYQIEAMYRLHNSEVGWSPEEKDNDDAFPV